MAWNATEAETIVYAMIDEDENVATGPCWFKTVWQFYVWRLCDLEMRSRSSHLNSQRRQDSVEVIILQILTDFLQAVSDTELMLKLSWSNDIASIYF